MAIGIRGVHAGRDCGTVWGKAKDDIDMVTENQGKVAKVGIKSVPEPVVYSKGAA